MKKSLYLNAFFILFIIYFLASIFAFSSLPKTASANPNENLFLYLPLIRSVSVSPSSFDLIDDALARGEIDAETALIYKVFASFGDSRLPPQYQGSDSQVRETDIFWQVLSQYDSLSAQAKTTLDPFLMPPYVPGSWVYLDTAIDNAVPESLSPHQATTTIEWGTISNPGSKVKVWYQKRFSGDDSKAQKVADAMDNKIWVKLVGLMGREPLDDGTVNSDNGGDSRLDIYLVHLGANYGEAWPYATSGQNTPAYILINTQKEEKYLLPTTAHEFMHVLIYTYPLLYGFDAWQWFHEASSTWAEDYVYPSGSPNYLNFHSEQEYAADFLDFPKESLDSKNNENHEYGAYLFPFYLDRMAHGTYLMPRIWENAATMTNLAAIDDQVNFMFQWPRFALYNLNRPPVDNYKTLDQLSYSALPNGSIQTVSLSGAQAKTYYLEANLPHLSASYKQLSFQGSEVRTVWLDPGKDVKPFLNYNLQYILQDKGTGLWGQPQDYIWSLAPNPFPLCFDVSEDQISQLVTIVSNSHISDPLTYNRSPNLFVTNIGCWSWTGTLDVTTVVASSNANQTETTHMDVIFEQSNFQGGLIDFKVVSGTAYWNHSGSIGECSGSGNGNLTIGPGDGVMWISIDPHLDFGNFDVSINFAQPPSIPYPCSSGGSLSAPLLTAGWWTPPEGWFISNDGVTMQGNRTVVSNNGETTTHFQLSLKAKPKTP